jgi:hypothetical protein
MSEWPNIRYTQARQIVRLFDEDGNAAPAPELTPQQWFATLREQGELVEAARFLGHGLPRMEAVIWGTRALEAMLPTERRADEEPLWSAIAAWLEDPSDQRRRRVWAEAHAIGADSPTRLLAFGLYFSGGSIAPEDQAHVNPEPHLCGRLVAAAVTAGAYATDAPEAHLEAALAAGDALARGG